jgi:hypothetical protein
MAWQEFVILAGSLLANAALLPTIMDSSARVPIRTSGTTASILVVQTAMFVSLGLVTTAIGTAIGTVGWVAILALRSELREVVHTWRTPRQQNAFEDSTAVPADD